LKIDKSKKDFYYNKAKDDGYFARSVYKLEEIDKKYRLIPGGAGNNGPFRVLDLGSAPGSWLQYVCARLGPQGRVTGIDIKEIKFCHPLLHAINKDIMEASDEDLLGPRTTDAPGGGPGFDLVLSDMAPNTCGIKSADQARSLELCEMAASVAGRLLKSNGTLLIKIFHGPDLKQFTNELKEIFRNVQLVKPESSRSDSSEIFILCRQKI
jgi:23S rRNA (uridine2552-2'-O)-methyltransferase